MKVKWNRCEHNWVLWKFTYPNKSDKTNKTKVYQIVLFGLLDRNNTMWWTKQMFNKIYCSSNNTVWWILILFVLFDFFANFHKTQIYLTASCWVCLAESRLFCVEEAKSACFVDVPPTHDHLPTGGIYIPMLYLVQ